MKRTLSILLAVMMLLSVAACNNAPASKKLTRGTWTGDEYANEFAGGRFTMPEGFVKLSDEELSEALEKILLAEPSDFKKRVFIALLRMDDAGWRALEALVEALKNDPGDSRPVEK